jgi:hypothetical protein
MNYLRISILISIQQMVRGADGMFFWAKLMIIYLNSPVLTPSSRRRTIKEIMMPEDLDAMYGPNRRLFEIRTPPRQPDHDVAGFFKEKV